MQRVTVSLDEEVAAAFDALALEQGYASRSRSRRDLVRRAVDNRRLQRSGDGLCVANLSYVYDHHVRALAGRLVALQHHHHELVISTTHVHLDHHTCLESTLLKGRIDDVRLLADGIQAEPRRALWGHQSGQHEQLTRLVAWRDLDRSGQ